MPGNILLQLEGPLPEVIELPMPTLTAVGSSRDRTAVT